MGFRHGHYGEKINIKPAKDCNLEVTLPEKIGGVDVVKIYVKSQSNPDDKYTIMRIGGIGGTEQWTCNCEHYYQRLLPLLNTDRWEPCKHIESVWNSGIEDRPEYKIRRALASILARIHKGHYGMPSATLREAVWIVEEQLRADGLI